MKNIVIFGESDNGIYQYYALSKTTNVIALSDNNDGLIDKKILDLPVISP